MPAAARHRTPGEENRRGRAAPAGERLGVSGRGAASAADRVAPPLADRRSRIRPFSSEGASFRSAIDAARERVHGAAREATPDDGEDNEPTDEDA